MFLESPLRPHSSATLLESHSSGARVLLGDDNGRLTAIGWEFEASKGSLESPSGQNGSVRVRKSHVGTVAWFL